MRILTAGLVLSAALVLGCTQWQRRGQLEQPIAATTEAPPAASLVEYLNTNARKVQAIQCTNVAIDCRQGNQPVGLDGQLVCQKPRNFRLKAKVVGQPAVDIGSNENEFWFWISKAEPPYVCHCSYQDLAKGNVRMPFPFQPDMIVAALGMQEYDPAKNYEVKASARTYELIESATSPQGQPVKKITVFDRTQVSGNRPQVIAHVLQDDKGQEICSATISEVQQNRQTGVILPFKVKLVYPAEKMEMSMRLYDTQVATIDAQRADKLFTRRDLANLPSYDLFKGALDNPGQGLQQTRGSMR